ncbi:YopN family type III secretion system gatekeeper subunit [Pantoea sp. Al-1710]|uniref:YopN family type III secretion system gatekeeper subunit n=1 Tax=Candidatus Pantoea communis TaxID=2608354 RepID=A0ABX0RNQ8_9GAMM|nr:MULTISPECIES: type III secretion system gatekeeper subunit SctW [Pantoea]NIG12930.1 YopN family type III secretion system gatekeeper subunit [Pantoea sp. Cy-640]NIG17369.1 YopN family type III secretion system gatekeeper subunit [Pantoea communis]
MNMHVHHPRRPHHPQLEENEALIESVVESKKKQDHQQPVHPIHQAKLQTEQAEHAAEGSLAQQIDQNRARIERQQQLNRAKKGGFLLRFTHIEQLSELLEGGRDEEQAERETRIRSILEKTPEREQLDALLQETDNDPASAYASLSLMAMNLEEGHQPQLLARIQAMLNQLVEQHGAEVSAGINTAHAFATFSTDKTQKKTLRKMYYEGVVGQQSSDSILDMLLAKFGVDGFLPALKTLQRALADDIASLAPSIPPMALRRLMNGLNDTQLLSNTIKEVTDFLTRIGQSFGGVKMSVDTMTRTLLGMCKNGFYSNQLLSLGLETIGDDSQRHPFYFNHLLRLIERLPENVWGDKGNHRDGAIKLVRTLNGELAQMEKNRLGHAL